MRHVEAEIVVDQNFRRPIFAAAQIAADRNRDGIFIKELEDALLDGRADLAVHSMKDVPTEILAGLQPRRRFQARRSARLPGFRATANRCAIAAGRAHRHQQLAARSRNCVTFRSDFRDRWICAAMWIRGCAKSPRANTTRSCWRRRASTGWALRSRITRSSATGNHAAGGGAGRAGSRIRAPRTRDEFKIVATA